MVVPYIAGVISAEQQQRRGEMTEMSEGMVREEGVKDGEEGRAGQDQSC
jgi:hypothetical protein